jgi:hypothetical protein
MRTAIADLRASSESYVSYAAMADLHDPGARGARARLLEDPKVVALVRELQTWPGPHINSHKSANQFFYKLAFLADIGLKRDDPGMESIIGKIRDSADENDVPCLAIEIPAGYGGTGRGADAWALCDAPSILYALKVLGAGDKKLDDAVRYFAKLHHDNGYGCVVSGALESWRGPGKKTDPCPYATLIMMKLLILYGDEYGREIAACAECLLDLWENSKGKHPYIFYMGTDFRKLKLPYVWYDILHVVNVISQVKAYTNDRRFLEMFKIIKEKETENGFIPESIYQPWKDWDFGQKRYASDWMTYCVRKIERRITIPPG